MGSVRLSNSPPPSTSNDHHPLNAVELQNLVVAPQMSTSAEIRGRIPRVHLDIENISDAMAARLAICLLGHVLFLKSQVPLPVAQLTRIRGGSSNKNAAKKRTELLESFDTLTSHLLTTFTALSSAFARSTTPRRRKNAFLAFLIGPSIGSARSKVVLAIDGLEVRVWGSREDENRSEPDGPGGEGEEGSDCASDVEDVPDSDEEDGDGDGDEDDEDQDGSGDDEVVESSAAEPSLVTPPQYRSTSPYADEKAFRISERALSRALANADGEGHGMFAELAPTQTHILLRAPRHFTHPSWLPRQNMSTTFDGMLQEFLDASKNPSEQAGDKPSSSKKKRKEVEGVWVACRDENTLYDADETDEMIWWSWDGKLVGFSDW